MGWIDSDLGVCVILFGMLGALEVFDRFLKRGRDAVRNL